MSFDRGKTILQVLPALDTGGVERGTVEMVQAIVNAGGTALVASAGGRMVHQVERAGGRHIPMALMTKDPLNILLNAGRLARLIRREGVDLVHARSRAPAWSAWRAARRTGVPLVTTWHGIYGEEFLGKHAYNSVMARGERVIAASRYIAERVLAGYRLDPSRLRIIPRGVDPAIFNPEAVGGDRGAPSGANLARADRCTGGHAAGAHHPLERRRGFPGRRRAAGTAMMSSGCWSAATRGGRIFPTDCCAGPKNAACWSSCAWPAIATTCRPRCCWPTWWSMPA